MAVLDSIYNVNVILGLTPVDRWNSAGNFKSFSMVGMGLVVVVLIAIVVVVAVAIKVVQGRKTVKDSATNFADHANKIGLSRKESQILFYMAKESNLDNIESIFHIPSIFDRQSTKLIEEILAQQGPQRSDQMRAEMSFIREKLAFKKRMASATAAGPIISDKITSRNIPVGQMIELMERSIDRDRFEAEVIKTTPTEFVVKLTNMINCGPGQKWRVHYYKGSSVWEFDAVINMCSGSEVTFKHSEEIRFVNRRRFLRVPINAPALVANFPFAKTLVVKPETDAVGESWMNENDESENDFEIFELPKFVHAKVVELGGPGLKIKCNLKAKIDDKLLIVFMVNEENQQGQVIGTKLLEDIGYVKNVEGIDDGYNIAIELAGLSEANVSELVKITNAYSIKNHKTADTSTAGGNA